MLGAPRAATLWARPLSDRAAAAAHTSRRSTCVRQTAAAIDRERTTAHLVALRSRRGRATTGARHLPSAHGRISPVTAVSRPPEFCRTCWVSATF